MLIYFAGGDGCIDLLSNRVSTIFHFQRMVPSTSESWEDMKIEFIWGGWCGGALLNSLIYFLLVQNFVAVLFSTVLHIFFEFVYFKIPFVIVLMALGGK